MSILIAESGSTHASWRLIHKSGAISQYKTEGVNPYLETTEALSLKISKQLKPQLSDESIKELFFYGSGCGADDKKEKVRAALDRSLSPASIEVHEDMLAAARALCGHERGIACILGTGSNSALYDGEIIVKQQPSFGFLLGDEGSGSYLGKILTKAYFEQELPGHISKNFQDLYQLSIGDFLTTLYERPYPNRYLAGFSPFILKYQSDPYIYRMVYDAFSVFLQKFVLKYPDAQQYKVSFVGSIAHYYNTILRKAVADQGLVCGLIMENAIAGLTLYHQQKVN